jgi:hypothetical protein
MIFDNVGDIFLIIHEQLILLWLLLLCDYKAQLNQNFRRLCRCQRYPFPYFKKFLLRFTTGHRFFKTSMTVHFEIFLFFDTWFDD